MGTGLDGPKIEGTDGEPNMPVKGVNEEPDMDVVIGLIAQEHTEEVGGEPDMNVGIGPSIHSSEPAG